MATDELTGPAQATAGRSVRLCLTTDLPVGGRVIPAGSGIWASAGEADRIIAAGLAIPAGGPVETATSPATRERAVGLRGRGG